MNPQALEARGTSDHSPVWFGLRPVGCNNTAERLFAREMFQHPKFKEILESILIDSDLDKLETRARWSTHKALLREAARITRNIIVANDEIAFSRASELISVGRAAVSNDTVLAQKIIAGSRRAREYVEVAGPNFKLKDPGKFQVDIARYKREPITKRKKEEEEEECGTND